MWQLADNCGNSLKKDLGISAMHSYKIHEDKEGQTQGRKILPAYFDRMSDPPLKHMFHWLKAKHLKTLNK